VRRECKLSAGVYRIEVRPVKGNLSAEGECGAWDSAVVQITLNGSEILNMPLQRWCSSPDIVSEITVLSGSRHVVVKTVGTSVFYGLDP